MIEGLSEPPYCPDQLDDVGIPAGHELFGIHMGIGAHACDDPLFPLGPNWHGIVRGDERAEHGVRPALRHGVVGRD